MLAAGVVRLVNATANPPHALPAPPLARFFIWSHAFDGPLRYGRGRDQKRLAPLTGSTNKLNLDAVG